jgi:hypothetical protein
VICLLLTAGLSACESGTTVEAEALVRQYLSQVATDGGDRGWSLLHPVTQQAHFEGDPDAYMREAEAEDWSSFSWQIGHVERDDPGRYEVVVLVEGEAPPLITKLATWMAGPSSPGPTFYIRFDQRGGSGIFEPGS